MKNMKKLLYLAIITSAALGGCSKGSSNHPHAPTSIATVSINGTLYNTVIIGSQTWTAVNYNGTGGANYNNGANNITYGKLYTWAEAKAILLPAGWRLPLRTDFDNLMIAIGETPINGGNYMVSGNEPLQIMSTKNWSSTNGTNQLGFAAEPAGLFNQVTSNNQQFTGLGTTALFISATSYYPNGSAPFTFVVGPVTAQLTNLVVLPTDRASVRFVKDN